MKNILEKFTKLTLENENKSFVDFLEDIENENNQNQNQSQDRSQSQKNNNITILSNPNDTVLFNRTIKQREKNNMKISESRLRQIIREVIKESKLDENKIDPSAVGKMAAAVFTIAGSVVLTQAVIQLVHIAHDHAKGEYCSLTGSVDFGFKDGKFKKELIENFAKNGLIISLEEVHDGVNLVLENKDKETFKIELKSTSVLPPSKRKVQLHRKRIANVIGRMISGEEDFDIDKELDMRTESNLSSDQIRLFKSILGADASLRASGFKIEPFNKKK